MDANHCPGAAMVVAHPPGGLPPVLHTGDARLTREATQQQAALQALVGRAVLVLDTTYADPSYCFPPQQEVLQWVLRAVQVGFQRHRVSTAALAAATRLCSAGWPVTSVSACRAWACMLQQVCSLPRVLASYADCDRLAHEA
jgi:hypothetical protein